MKSERTQLCKKRWIIFTVVSYCLWLGAALFAIISAFAKGFDTSAANNILSEEFKTKLTTWAITAIILIILVIFMGHKMRMTIWMAAVIISTIVYGEAAMYTLFSIWFVDEYVLQNLSKYYKSKWSINKEIDIRGE